MNAGQILSNILGTKPDLDEKAVHAKIIELENRVLWIESELGSEENQSLETCRYSRDMMESLEDEKNLLSLLTNVMYRREKLLENCK